MQNENTVDFDNFIEGYNGFLQESTQFFSASDTYFAKYKIDIMRKNIHFPVNRLLEYGCGIGRNIAFLQKSFPYSVIVGSDISIESLKQASTEYPNTKFYHEAELEKTKERFDLIFVAGVYHHIPPNERTSTSAILHERLTSEGRIVIFEHNPYNPVTQRIVKKCPYDKGVVLIKPSELKKNLEQAGLLVEKKSYCLFVPPRLKWLNKIEDYLAWLPLGGQYWIQARRKL